MTSLDEEELSKQAVLLGTAPLESSTTPFLISQSPRRFRVECSLVLQIAEAST